MRNVVKPLKGKTMNQFVPKLFDVMKGYSKKQFVNDVIAGIIVAIIALPLSIALALASGVGPEQGIYTAIFAGFVISFLGGSRVQIAGPTAAFATIVAGIVAQNGMDGLIVATIMAGIILSMPRIFIGAYDGFITSGTYESALGILFFSLFILTYILIIVGIIWIQLAERRIPIQYANKSTSAYGAQNSFLPIKLNSAGVMPVIFASILTTIPATIVALTKNQNAIDFVNKYIVYNTPTGFVLYIILILFFGYFYTFMVMNPDEMSKNLNERGGYIPGIRPGEDTSKYISNSMGKLTFVGSIFLVILAAIPVLFSLIFKLSSAVTIGGTGMLIVVSVAIEFNTQLEAQLMAKRHKNIL